MLFSLSLAAGPAKRAEWIPGATLQGIDLQSGVIGEEHVAGFAPV